MKNLKKLFPPSKRSDSRSESVIKYLRFPDSKRSNSRSEFEIKSNIFPNSKRSQSEVISTILLILISIAAIAIITPVVFNLVNSKKNEAKCFDFRDSIKISNNPSYTCFSSNEKVLRIQISFGKINGTIKSFVINILGNSSKTFEIINDTSPGEVVMYKNENSKIFFPGDEEERTYNLTGVDSRPNKIDVSIKLNDGLSCGPIDSINNVVSC